MVVPPVRYISPQSQASSDSSPTDSGLTVQGRSGDGQRARRYPVSLTLHSDYWPGFARRGLHLLFIPTIVGTPT